MEADERSLATSSVELLPTVMGGLALIVISFVGLVWRDVVPGMERQALVVVNASGAHFFLSLVFVGAVQKLARSHKIIKERLSSPSIFGALFYIYWALLIQHWGIADILLTKKWDSSFLFTAYVFPLLNGSNSDQMFYVLPFYLASLATIGLIPIFWGADLIKARLLRAK